MCGRGHNSALLEPTHPLWPTLAGVAVAPLWEGLAQTYRGRCGACRELGLGLLCEEHEAIVTDVDAGSVRSSATTWQAAGWQSAGPDDRTTLIEAITD
jgi:hypothetical protein